MKKAAIFVLILICKLNSCYKEQDLERTEILDTARIVFFYGETYEEQRAFPLPHISDILYQDEFVKKKKTLLYIFGFIENLNEESVKTIVDAYLRRGDHNILVVDWSRLVTGMYILNAFPNAIRFSNVLADALLDLLKSGLDIGKLHIVSHSLGSQLASMTARKLKKKSNYKIKRISALDPAFPMFYPGLIAGHLSKYDAEFVDVIHTDAWLYGAPVSTGTADFWPNGAILLQTGCPTRNYQLLTPIDLCSHWRSWRFWAESVAPSSLKTFQSRKCDSWLNFKRGKCDRNKVVNMGLDCPTNIQGDFYLQTNGYSPYARGKDGTEYTPEIQ